MAELRKRKKANHKQAPPHPIPLVRQIFKIIDEGNWEQDSVALAAGYSRDLLRSWNRASTGIRLVSLVDIAETLDYELILKKKEPKDAKK